MVKKKNIRFTFFLTLLGCLFIMLPMERDVIYAKQNNVEQSLIAHWAFDEDSADDKSGNGFHGTVHNAVHTKTEQYRCFNFNGKNSYIRLPSIINLAETNFTIALWINMGKDVAKNSTILSQNNMGLLVKTPDNKILTGIFDGLSMASNIEIIPNQWYHVALTYDGTKVRIYINGQLDSEGEGVLRVRNAPLFIGAKENNIASQKAMWLGLIDDLRIYKSAINEDEIKSIIEEGAIPIIAPSEPPIQQLNIPPEVAAKKYSPAKVNVLLPSPIRKVLNLDGIFEFKDDPDSQGETEKWFEGSMTFNDTIKVPGNLMVAGYRKDRSELEATTQRLTEYKDNLYPPAWYKRKFIIPSTWDLDKPIWLKFGGVHPACKVWLNGEYVGSHMGAFVPFKLNVTDVALVGRENILVVKIEEGLVSRIMGGHYNKKGFWSGLFRSVEVEQTDNIWIEDFFINPDIDQQTAVIKVWLHNTSAVSKELIVQADIIDGSSLFSTNKTTVIAKADEVTEAQLSVNMQGAKLWGPGHAKLYEAKITLQDREGVIDSLRDRFGMRKIHVSEGKIYVNNKPFYIRGTGSLCVNAQTLSPSISREDIKKELSTLINYGFNYIRFHSAVPVPEYLDVADELGIFIQEEAVIVGTYAKDFDYSDDIKRDTWINIIRRDWNHPSLMTRCMGNEQGNVTMRIRELIEYAYNTAKELDKMRLVISTASSENRIQNQYSDIIESNGDYIDKPYFRHEFGHWSSYPDIRLKNKYIQSALTPWHILKTEESANRNGLGNMLIGFTQKSQALQRITRKYGLEWFRLNKPDADGYTMWLAQDSLDYQMGLLDDFFERKNVTPQDLLRSNGETVLLVSGTEFEKQYWSGDHFLVDISVHHTGENDITNARLEWKLEDVDAGAVIDTGFVTNITVLPGRLEKILTIDTHFPVVESAKRVRLTATLKGQSVNAENEWLYWCYPKSISSNLQSLMQIDINDATLSNQIIKSYPLAKRDTPNKADLFITDHESDALNEHLKNGGRALILAKGVYEQKVKDYGEDQSTPRIPEKWVTFMTTSGYYGKNYWGDIIDTKHPLMQKIPNEGFCDFGFVHLLYNASAIYLDSFTWAKEKVTPIIRVIDSYESNRQLAYLFEAEKDKGKLLVSSFTFNLEKPECLYMFNQMVEYLDKQTNYASYGLEDTAQHSLLKRFFFRIKESFLDLWKR